MKRFTLLVATLCVAGCGAGHAVTRTVTTSAAASGTSLALRLAPSVANSCRVFLIGYDTEVDFYSGTFGVQPDCQSWIEGGAKGSELWGEHARPSGDALSVICRVAYGPVTATVTDAANTDDVYGQSACERLLAAGWREL